MQEVTGSTPVFSTPQAGLFVRLLYFHPLPTAQRQYALALELTTAEIIDRQYAVNVRGPIDVVRAFLPHFRERRSGKLINIKRPNPAVQVTHPLCLQNFLFVKSLNIENAPF
jgi:NAD(P)-dependent dehydrogenase (short-subunit alcohol dehydrogenase family)